MGSLRSFCGVMCVASLITFLAFIIPTVVVTFSEMNYVFRPIVYPIFSLSFLGMVVFCLCYQLSTPPSEVENE